MQPTPDLMVDIRNSLVCLCVLVSALLLLPSLLKFFILKLALKLSSKQAIFHLISGGTIKNTPLVVTSKRKYARRLVLTPESLPLPGIPDVSQNNSEDTPNVSKLKINAL